MKKFAILISILCLTALPFGFTACGSDEATITGIYASIVPPDADNYSDALSNRDTASQNDYILETGKTYHLTVEYTAYGGSKYPGFASTEGINLSYDAEALEITLREQDRFFAQIVRYELVCKRAVDHSAILIEVNGTYCYTLVVCSN